MANSAFDEFNSSNVVSFRHISNRTPQESLVVRILPDNPYTADHDIVIVGAHMDSIIHPLPSSSSIPPLSNSTYWDVLNAPGADDNASSYVMLLEVARVIARLFAKRRVHNEVQFHFWAAEEIGLVGSRSVFSQYRNESKLVKAVLNFDMVGWPGKKKHPRNPRIAVHGNHVHQNLTDFTKKIIEAYSTAKPGDTSCEYKCSDHATAWENGFPSAALGESGFLDGETFYPYIHTPNDVIKHLDLDYILEFAKVTVGFLAELAYTNFTEVNHRAGIN